MDADKVQAAAQIIKNSVVTFLANKHGITEDQVIDAVLSGDVKANQQFKELVIAGINQTLKMHDDGEINLH